MVEWGRCGGDNYKLEWWLAEIYIKREYLFGRTLLVDHRCLRELSLLHFWLRNESLQCVCVCKEFAREVN